MNLPLESSYPKAGLLFLFQEPVATIKAEAQSECINVMNSPPVGFGPTDILEERCIATAIAYCFGIGLSMTGRDLPKAQACNTQRRDTNKFVLYGI
jgi:hypothetical protein